MFNDDIQGTGAVILAGIINAVKENGVPIHEQKAVLLGAGSAAVGVAKQIVQFFMSKGLTEDEARKCFYLVDTKGLVTNDRGDKLAEHKLYFSRDDNHGKQFKDLAETVDYVKPTMLLGLSTIGGALGSADRFLCSNLDRTRILAAIRGEPPFFSCREIMVGQV